MALINILDDLVLYFSIEPVVCAEPMLKIIMPLALVLLILSVPIHNTIAWFLVVFPLPLVSVAWGVFHFAFSMSEALVEVPFIKSFLVELEKSVAVPDSVFPLSCIFGVILMAIILTFIVSLSIKQFPLIPASIRPFIDPQSRDIIPHKWSLVFKSTCPDKLALTMHKSVREVSFIKVSIFELYLPISLETLEVTVRSWLDFDVTVPSGVVFSYQFHGKEWLGGLLVVEKLCHISLKIELDCLKIELEK